MLGAAALVLFSSENNIIYYCDVHYLLFMVGILFLYVIMDEGTQWLHSRVDINGYEEYSGTEFRSAGCSEEYNVIE